MKKYKELIERCCRLIAERGWTIAFAESVTARKLAFEFSMTPDSGAVLKGSLVCYNACIKEDILGIPKEMIDLYTPESAEVTREMAARIKKLMKAEVSVAVTGLSSPGGSEQPGKPVGTMFYCIYIQRQVVERKKIFTGTAAEIIDLSLEHIAQTIIHELEGAS